MPSTTTPSTLLFTPHHHRHLVESPTMLSIRGASPTHSFSTSRPTPSSFYTPSQPTTIPEFTPPPPLLLLLSALLLFLIMTQRFRSSSPPSSPSSPSSPSLPSSPRLPRLPTQVPPYLLLLAFLTTVLLSSSYVVGWPGALFFHTVLTSGWYLVNVPTTLPSSRAWQPRARAAARGAGWIALAYATFAIFACIASEVMRRPKGREAVMKVGFYVSALPVLAISVGAVAGMGWVLGRAWPLVKSTSVQGEEAGEKDSLGEFRPRQEGGGRRKEEGGKRRS